jgi:hypothetical protein
MNHNGWTRQHDGKDNAWPSSPISHNMSVGVGTRNSGGIWEATPSTPIFLTPPASPSIQHLSPKMYVNSMQQAAHGPPVAHFPQLPHRLQPQLFEQQMQSRAVPARQHLQQREEIEPLSFRSQPDRDMRRATPPFTEGSFAAGPGGQSEPSAATSGPTQRHTKASRDSAPSQRPPLQERPPAAAASTTREGRPPLPGNDGPTGHTPPLDHGQAVKKRDYFEILGVERDCSGTRPLYGQTCRSMDRHAAANRAC